MKFIKITMLTFALVASTATLAQSREELCHNAAESDIAIKRSLQKTLVALQGSYGTLMKLKITQG